MRHVAVVLVVMIVTLILTVATAAHAVPDVVTYAARVEDANGPFDGTVSLTFTVYDAPAGGDALWSDSVASAMVLDGDLVHELTLDDAVLARDDVYLQLTLDGEDLEPRVPIRAVPFALKARDADTLQGLAPDDLVTRDDLAAWTPAPASIDAVAIKNDSIRADDLRGVEALVYVEPAGCGGHLSTHTTCASQLCAVDDGAARFASCDGTQCTLAAAASCSSTAVGLLLSNGVL